MSISQQMLERWHDILATFMEIFPADLVRIAQATPSAGMAILASQTSYRPIASDAARELADKHCRTVLATRSEVYISETTDETDTPIPPFSYIGLPIFRSDGTIFGVLDVVDVIPKTRGRAELRLIEHFRYSIEDQLAQMDATEKQQQAEAQLRLERDRLHLATMASGSGIWDYNIDEDFLYCDERWHRILGIDPNPPITSIQAFKPHIHPDDVQRATEINNTLAQLLTAKEDYHLSFRIMRPDGTIRWVRSSACIVEATGDSPTRAVGAIVDVTEQVDAESKLAASEARFRALADTVPQMIFSTTADGATDYVNKRFFEFTGASEGPEIDEIWRAFLHPEDCDRVAEAWRNAVATNADYDNEYRYRYRSGEYRWVRALAKPLFDDDGRISRWFGAITDINEAKLLERERELVARELDHRIQNIFALVDGLISLSQRDDPDAKPFASRLRDRLSALNKAHNLIQTASRTMTAQSLHGLVESLLKPYESIEYGRIQIEGTDTPIRDGMVTSLALVFHELATNSAKYGALQSPAGQLTLRFDHLDGMLHVKWRERGDIHGTALSDRNGFGSKLIESLVKSRMQGELARTFTNDGVDIDLLLPLKTIQAHSPT